ncbi:diaminopimelate decarboxylase [Luteipulveratus sp. YIM 133132]|uniref:Diaminopimelate decarboxylase n=1 Tax=Luteipulveratus flavus TaxID=3031728 RepID=A0ABT6C8F1_9MICO|nr:MULTISPECIES: diaminopimelate decarboxylase [unclassified Luteipulveratus]MDE9365077.1 diaminopimelate decarboxylase [Luteipulveratus sp. YIM 133132]MDF8264587.1 diaminopimelate decarboxylase [Luteipulveratus sp. YIM 133296]
MTEQQTTVQGVALKDIAEEFGTPCFVYDGDVLEGTFTRLRQALHERLEIFYSLKANPNVSVYSVLRRAGARAEVSSLVELRTALLAGTPPEDVIFLGPGKSVEELSACLDAGAVTLVAESFEELDLIERLAGERGGRARVALRINPSFSVKGSGLTMGGKPRQFGIDDEQVLAAENLAAGYPHVHLVGVHVYMGTRILNADVVVENTARILALADQVAARHGIELELVDVGGGLGVAYFEGEQDPDVDRLAAGINPLIEDFVARHENVRLAMELGRYLAADAGLYLTRVRYTKTSRGERFAVADGGTNHHMPAVGVGSFVRRNFPIDLVGAADQPREPWNVSGPLCTPNDLLAKNAMLPPLRQGDLVAVHRSGAYGPTASPGLFLSHGYPAEVLVLDGRAHLVRSSDRPQDLLDRQHLVVPSPPVVAVD